MAGGSPSLCPSWWVILDTVIAGWDAWGGDSSNMTRVSMVRGSR